MRIASLADASGDAVLQVPQGWLPVRAVARGLGEPWPSTFLELLESGGWDELKAWHDGERGSEGAFGGFAGDCLDPESARLGPPLRRPRKIWGIGLNYRDHAADLDETAPSAEPASFMKPDTAVVGPGETLRIPRLSRRTTGEAELGVVFARAAREVERADWLSAVAGFTTVIDLTAEDILRRNPRNLTQAKSFDTFFSFGPVVATPDEFGEIAALRVRTLLNGEVHAENVVANMTFPPDFLVSYHSQIFSWLPGDVLSTGTPGAAPLAHGDVVGCRIDGLPDLSNPVVDLKASRKG